MSFATDIGGIINGAYKFACEEWCRTREPIDMVGWSRGGLSVIEVANMLNEKGCTCCGDIIKPVPVRFLGLYDPVDMTCFAGGLWNEVPSNVRNGLNVYGREPRRGRHGSYRQGVYYGVDYVSPHCPIYNWPRIVAFRGGAGMDISFNCTHGALGGCPGYSSDPLFDTSNYRYFWDREQSITADRMMRIRAQASGVPIDVLSREDYGFPAHQSNLPPIGS